MVTIKKYLLTIVLVMVTGNGLVQAGREDQEEIIDCCICSEKMDNQNPHLTLWVFDCKIENSELKHNEIIHHKCFLKMLWSLTTPTQCPICRSFLTEEFIDIVLIKQSLKDAITNFNLNDTRTHSNLPSLRSKLMRIKEQFSTLYVPQVIAERLITYITRNKDPKERVRLIAVITATLDLSEQDLLEDSAQKPLTQKEQFETNNNDEADAIAEPFLRQVRRRAAGLNSRLEAQQPRTENNRNRFECLKCCFCCLWPWH